VDDKTAEKVPAVSRDQITEPIKSMC